MGIIIGANSHVFAEFSQATTGCDGATQASWEYTTNTERLYELGSWSSCSTYDTPQQTLNLTFYSGSTVSWPVTPVLACDNDFVWAYITIAGCFVPDVNLDTGAVTTVTNTTIGCSSAPGCWSITGYNYSKSDARQPGTESWSLQRYTGQGNAAPDFNIRGISEGSINSEESDVNIAQTQAGVVFDSGSEVSIGLSGSVSAGQVGRAEFVYANVVTHVGGSTAPTGSTGSAQVSIPYTPLWTYSV